MYKVKDVAHHGNSLAHEAFMIRSLLRIHGVWYVNRFVVLARFCIHLRRVRSCQSGCLLGM